MLSLFKKLFTKSAETKEAQAAPSKPATTPPTPSATPSAAPQRAAGAGPDDIVIPLKAIVPGMTDSIKKRIDKELTGSEVVWISKGDALRQLASGAVKLSFEEVIRMCPNTFLTPDRDLLSQNINLPLQEILPKIKTLPKRAAQKQMEVPQDYAPVFGTGKEASREVKPTGVPAVAAAPAPAPVAAPEPAPLNIPAPATHRIQPPTPQVPKPGPAEGYAPPSPKPLEPQAPLKMPSIEPAPAPAPAPITMPKPAPTTPPPPAFTPPAPTPIPAAAPAPAPVAQDGPVIAFGDIFGMPDKKEWSPQEVVEKAATLRGVAGALITTIDGLPVASHLPTNLSGNTVAAFVPQMYTRIVQYTRDLKLGDARHLTILIENVPLQIFKSGGVYFTVLGRANENLPKPQLTAIAAALGRQTQP